MRNLKQIKNPKGKKILVRVDFNVPMDGRKVRDDFRIRKAIPTIKYLKKLGAKIILITHLGKGGETLAPVAEALAKYTKVKFVENILGIDAEVAINEMKNGDVILLENLRNDKGEQSCDRFFASSLAKLGEAYVNEAFSVSHRQDASIVLLPKLLPSYAGFQLEDEIKHLSLVFKKPKHPFLFILGGAKFDTKLPILNKYIRFADKIFIGGALLNDFLRAEGEAIGDSLSSGENLGIQKLIGHPKIILPDDVLVKTKDGVINKSIHDVGLHEFILDVGNHSVRNLLPLIQKAKLILWNGPLGDYEIGGDVATKKVLKAVAKSKAVSVIGGGDTAELVSALKMEKKFSFVSTGGGATLDFLANKNLPGIKAL